MKTVARWIGVYGLLCTSGAASDWPAWRGPDDTGATREKAAVTSWSPDGENVLWKSDIGGRTTPIVMGGRIYFLAPVGEGISTQERVVCLDAATGKLAWERRFNVYLTDVVENRVGWTAMAGDPETGNVYAHGTGGELFAYDRDGKLLWKRALTEEFGRISGYGGRLFSPVVDEDRVIIGMNCAVWGSYAKGGHRFIAFDKRTGEVVWFVEPGGAPLDTTYATPVVAVIGGVRQLICPCADGFVYGLKSRTGERLWAFQASRRPLNTSPVVDGSLVYVTHSEENIDSTVMGRAVCFDVSKLVAPPPPKPAEGAKPADSAKRTEGAKPGDSTKPGEDGKPAEGPKSGQSAPPTEGAKPVEPQKPADAPKPPDVPRATEVWRADGLDAGYCSPALANGRLYIVDNSATLYALDAKTGDQKWKQRLGRVGKGSPVVTADGVIYYGEQNGYVWILKDEGDKCTVLDKEQLKPVNSQVDEVFGSPAVVDGHVFLMTRYATYALGAKHEPTASSVDAGHAGKDAPSQKEAARMRMLPAEVSLRPGDALQFKTNVKELQLVPKEGETLFKVTGVKGAVSDDGLLTITKDNVFSAGTVACPAGSAAARVRVSPKPPFTFDFESVAVDAVPPGWIGVGGKSKVVEMGGGKVLMKLAEQPSAPMMRMRAYMTPPIAGGYTIAADMMSTLKPPTTKADIGLINTRYRLLLMGELNVLRIDSWDTMPRVLHDVPLNWKEGIWMRMKFQVELADKSGGGQEAHLRGKVWATDEPEPKDWMIEFTDPYPNAEGSPGPYAYSNGTTPKSKGAEVYFDNIEVAPNK